LREKTLTGCASLSEFCDRAAYYMGEFNAVYPFRDGNGRTQREFIRQLALEKWLFNPLVANYSRRDGRGVRKKLSAGRQFRSGRDSANCRRFGRSRLNYSRAFRQYETHDEAASFAFFRFQPNIVEPACVPESGEIAFRRGIAENAACLAADEGLQSVDRNPRHARKFNLFDHVSRARPAANGWRRRRILRLQRYQTEQTSEQNKTQRYKQTHENPSLAILLHVNT
jgi:hypothetical protein